MNIDLTKAFASVVETKKIVRQFRSRLEHEETVLDEALQYLSYVEELLARQMEQERQEN